MDTNLTTLLDFRYQHKYKAERGGDGAAKDMFGKNGGDLVLKVPLGTVVTDLDTGELIADLNTPDADCGDRAGAASAGAATPTSPRPSTRRPSSRKRASRASTSG